MNEQTQSNPRLEEIKVKGNQLIEKVKEIVESGNARHVMIKKDGRVLMEFPLSVGVGGAAAALVLAPTLAAVGAIAALVTEITIVVESDPVDALPGDDSPIVSPDDTI